MMLVVLAALAWILVFLLTGQTEQGRDWYGDHNLFDDKGGIVLGNIGLPLLGASTVISLVLLQRPRASWLQRLFRRRCCWIQRAGPNRIAFQFVTFPLLINIWTNVRRHLQEDLTYSEAVMEVSNSFGIGATLALGLLFVPVSHFSPIFQALGVSQSVRWHVWLGRVVILASAVHGVGHMYRWSAVAHESLWRMILPPAPCWSLSSSTEYTPTCHDRETECTCYHHFRNLAGVVALVGLLVIGFSSLDRVRRATYSIFYRIHVVAGPLVVLMVALHWNRSILYMGGGLLYYLASSAPVWIERYRRKPVEVVQTELIPPSTLGERSCVSLTFAATRTAVQRYRAGQYLHVSVPSLSGVAHPFSVNLVPGHDDRMRIVFRVTGPFTRAFAEELRHEHPPAIYMHGFNGEQQMLWKALQHDAVVIVAGGIGITPYLSLLHQMSTTHGIKPRVILHWICRDAPLIDYVIQEYFSALRVSGLNIKIIVHRTGNSYSDSRTPLPSYSDEECATSAIESWSPEESTGTPFQPSLFAVGSKSSRRANLPSFCAALLIGWVGLCLLWICYYWLQSTRDVASRGIAIVVVSGWALLAGWIVNLVCRREEIEADPEFSHLPQDEGGVELDEMSPSDEVASADLAAGLAKSTKTSGFQLEESEGRPSPHVFANDVDDAKDPALFVCGPKALVSSVRSVLRDRCMVDRECCGSRIRLYEEAFEL